MVNKTGNRNRTSERCKFQILVSTTALLNDYIRNPLLTIIKFYMRLGQVVSLMSVCFFIITRMRGSAICCVRSQWLQSMGYRPNFAHHCPGWRTAAILKKNMKSPSNSGFCCRINHSYYSLYYCRDMVISNLVTMEDCDSECRSQPEPVFTLLTTISQPLKPKDLFLNYLKTVHGLTLLIESVKNWTVNISLTQISTTGTESFTHKMAALEFCQ